MEPLICPQCGGQITNYSPGQTFVTCSYCSTKFLVDANKQPPPQTFTADQDPPEFVSLDSTGYNTKVVAGILTLIFVGGLVLLFAFVGAVKKASIDAATGHSGPYSTTPKSTSTPAPTPNPNLIEFGGEGTDNGHFHGANSIAVDKSGRIYVSDDKLRVQRFSASGNFLSSIQVPAKGANYTHARAIDKIDVGSNGNLYVAVGGVILIYTENSTAPIHTIQVAPDYIQDFALRNDGSVLMISSSDQIETLNFVNKSSQITRRIEGFHTNPADAVMSPAATGIAAIRLAVDLNGNIFSIYALGDLGSYSLSYDREDFTILSFTPNGKFVRKFGQTMSSCGITVDRLGRMYLSESDSIRLVNANGENVGSIADVKSPRAFALDADNNVYILSDNWVLKRPAVK